MISHQKKEINKDETSRKKNKKIKPPKFNHKNNQKLFSKKGI